MSRLAKNSINISENVTCKFESGNFYAKGKLGEMTLVVNNLFIIEIKENKIFVVPKDDKDKLNPNWGTTRSLINNIVQGVHEGFNKTLELINSGDDYELCFTADEDKLNQIIKLSKTLNIPLTEIGRITSSKELILYDKDQKPMNPASGYKHF